MIQIEGELKEWGNSYGIRIRKEDVKKHKLKGKLQLIITTKKESRKALESIWGIGKNMTKSTQEIKDELREGWD